MDQVVSDWLSSQNIGSDVASELRRSLGRSYTIYGRMLLLSSKTLAEFDWDQIEDHTDASLYCVIAKRFGISHIAINKPIPPHLQDLSHRNIIRAPVNFTPLYGDFGPATCADPPTQADLDSAFWTMAKQNGIWQTWAPRWTMFSRGNLSEKTRLLSLPTVKETAQQGTINGTGSCVVDLYVGIGYFAFSYLKAGVTMVLGWDLNPWSVEGLRRGAVANRWDVEVVPSTREINEIRDVRLVVFNESNSRATQRIALLRNQLPPIRHVNCGLLPTSQGSWRTALALLDPKLGGWVHVHENLAVVELERLAQDITMSFQTLVDESETPSLVELDCVQRVKTYAPGVMHCVLDIQIIPHP